MTTHLRVKHGRRYRPATREEILSAAAALHIGETRGEQLRSPRDALTLCRALCAGHHQERFACIWLDTRHRVLEAEVLFNGTVDGASVYPRTVCQRALQLNAAAIIVAHNHPSGVAEPSESDRAITTRLVDALRLVDVRLLDHLVVTGDSFTSLAERGWI